MAHLFIRDPLVIFSETIDQDDASSSDHFEVKKEPCFLCVYANSCLEHSINELANIAIQTTATELAHRLASRISEHGGTNNGF
jgi:hypothetical protein